MKPRIDYDVVVVGAGPGGSSTAMQLARFGLNVAIVERSEFPRPHVGICISDQTLALFHYLGLSDNLTDTRFWRRNVTAVKWGTSSKKFVPQRGFHLDRGILDQSMVRKAQDAGVVAYQPARVFETRRLEDSSWLITIANDVGQQELKGRFLVDAAGRKPALPGLRLKDSPPLVALYANWSLKQALKFDGLIESGREAWLWYAQTASHQAVISVFCDPRYFKTKKKTDLQSKYVHLLRQFQMLHPDQFGRQISEPRGCDASSRHSDSPVSDQHIRVGDACLSVDPLSSQGVHLALLSGMQAATVVNTLLKMPENGELAKQFYQTRVAERVNRYTNRTKIEYKRVLTDNSDPFWRERAKELNANESHTIISPRVHAPPASKTHVSISPKVVIEKAAVVDGNFVKEQRVLRHPNIDGAVAFVEGVDLIPLLRTLPETLRYCDIPIYWKERVSYAMSGKIISWLWDKRVLEETN